GEDLLEEILNAGQGCLLLGAHMGSFEILRALGTTNRIEVAVVMYEENARMVNTLARAINPELAKCIIPLGRFDSMLKVQERLQGNQWVGILGDRTLDAADAMQEVTFLGETAALPTAPFRIALMLKRPVVLMLGLYRGGNRYELYFEKLFDPVGVERTERASAVEKAVRLYATRLEHYCREAAYNWFNFYDFWRLDPRSGICRYAVDSAAHRHRPPCRAARASAAAAVRRWLHRLMGYVRGIHGAPCDFHPRAQWARARIPGGEHRAGSRRSCGLERQPSERSRAMARGHTLRAGRNDLRPVRKRADPLSVVYRLHRGGCAGDCAAA